jgi:hypothetical protein
MSTTNTTTSLFYCQWKVFSDKVDDCHTLFGSMDDEADEQSWGPEVELIGMWLDSGNGCAVCRAKDDVPVLSWMLNWSSFCDITITPILDDNEAKAVVLKGSETEVPFQMRYETEGEARTGESLYRIQYTVQPGKRVLTYDTFAKMSEQEHKANIGDIRMIGRYHNLGIGCGLVIVASKTAADVHQHVWNWASMVDCDVSCVASRHVTRQMIRNKPGFEHKLKVLRTKLGIPDTPATL